MIDKPDKKQEHDAVTDHMLEASPGSETVLSAPQRRKGTSFVLFVAALALFLAVIGIGAGYKHWQRMHVKVKANQAKLEQFEVSMQAMPQQALMMELEQRLQQHLQQSQGGAVEQLKQMQQLHSQTREFADKVDEQIAQITLTQSQVQQGVPPNDSQAWKRAELVHLLQMANQSLYLSTDKLTAIAALQQADSELAKLGEINLLPLRQQLAKDLAVLEQYQPADVAALTHILLSIKQDLPGIAVAGAQTGEVVEVSPSAAPETGEATSIWDKYQNQVLSLVKEVVVVRRYDQPVALELDSEARVRAYELVKLRLETLQLLLLQRQQNNFQQQLKLVQETIRQYYPAQQADAVLAQLQVLEGVDLQPKVPDISGSLTMLQAMRGAN